MRAPFDLPCLVLACSLLPVLYATSYSGVYPCREVCSAADWGRATRPVVDAWPQQLLFPPPEGHMLPQDISAVQTFYFCSPSLILQSSAMEDWGPCHPAASPME